MSDNERQAQAYARRGWPVFPCIPGEKVPVTTHGFHEATTDPDRIARWWSRNPDRNVAIATGAPGPDVLDVDRHGDGSGFPALNKLQRAGLVGRPQALIRTPSGGMHAYYDGTDQRNGHIAAQHLDFRSHGGYVVAPPSRVGGRPYVVARHEPSAATFDWAKAKELLDPQPQRPPQRERQAEGPRDPSHLADWVARQPEGNRNAGLFWAANRAIEAGRPDALDSLARAAQDAGLTEVETRRTIRSAQQQGTRPAQRGTARPFEHQHETEAEAG